MYFQQSGVVHWGVEQNVSCVNVGLYNEMAAMFKSPNTMSEHMTASLHLPPPEKKKCNSKVPAVVFSVDKI